MKKIFVPLLLGLTMAGPAWAFYMTGGITGIDPSRHEITLDSATTYVVDKNVKLSDLAIGDRIRFDREIQNGKPVIDKIIKGG